MRPQAATREFWSGKKKGDQCWKRLLGYGTSTLEMLKRYQGYHQVDRVSELDLYWMKSYNFLKSLSTQILELYTSDHFYFQLFYLVFSKN